MAGSLSVAAANAQTADTRPITVTSYEYGNYDYYNVGAPQPTPAVAPAPPVPIAPPPAGAAPSCSATQSSGACNSTCSSCEHVRFVPSRRMFLRAAGTGSIAKIAARWNCCDEDAHRYFDCCCLKEREISIYGFADGGIEGNPQNPPGHYNGPVTFPDRDDGQFNQLYTVIERAAPKDNCGWYLGGRIDMLYGSDYFFNTAAGLDGTPNGNFPRWGNSTDQYGLAMPQLYVETDYNDLKIKWGHFYTIIGYEVVPATGNFFYSHAYTHQYGEPFTHTGILASKPYNDNWTLYAGIDNGWNAFDCDSGANFLGGVTYTSENWGSLAFAIQTGDDSTVNLPGIAPLANRTMYSIVWTRNFNSRWTYVFEHDLGVQQDAATLQGTDTAEWYGINQYLFYKLNCKWTAGARIEWFRDDDGFNVTGLRPGNPLVGNFFAGNFYEVTLGLNYKPNANIIVRPEVRWDWFNPSDPLIGSQNPYDNNTSKNQFLIGIDGIVQF